MKNKENKFEKENEFRDELTEEKIYTDIDFMTKEEKSKLKKERQKKKRGDGSKYVIIIQSVLCVAVVLMFFGMKYVAPTVFDIVNKWYSDLISQELPVTFFNELFGG